jgi:hypothetical protein
MDALSASSYYCAVFPPIQRARGGQLCNIPTYRQGWVMVLGVACGAVFPPIRQSRAAALILLSRVMAAIVLLAAGGDRRSTLAKPGELLALSR